MQIFTPDQIMWAQIENRKTINGECTSTDECVLVFIWCETEEDAERSGCEKNN